jgi:hypothetical protein
VVEPAPPPLTDCELVINPCIAGRFWIKSVTVVTPDRLISSEVISWTGRADSPLIRLIDEPVISTRWVSCARAGDDTTPVPPKATNKPVQSLVLWNMSVTPEDVEVDKPSLEANAYTALLSTVAFTSRVCEAIVKVDPASVSAMVTIGSNFNGTVAQMH